MKYVLGLIGLTLSSLTYAANEKGSETRIETSMDRIAKSYTIPCESELRTLATAHLKTNPHRMLPYSEVSDDVHLFNALTVTEYRDRQSHVTFHGVRNSAGKCDTSVTESYLLQTSCADSRHEAFSKYEFQGKLNPSTMVLASKRVEGKQAMLTDQFNQFCLVTTRQVVYN